MKKIPLETFIKQPKDDITSASITYNDMDLFLFLRDKTTMIELMEKQEKPKDTKCTVK